MLTNEYGNKQARKAHYFCFEGETSGLTVEFPIQPMGAIVQALKEIHCQAVGDHVKDSVGMDCMALQMKLQVKHTEI